MKFKILAMVSLAVCSLSRGTLMRTHRKQNTCFEVSGFCTVHGN